MLHLDEGTLHALLDGELDLAEVKEIQTHLGSCAACGSRLQDVKQFLSEADSLVAALETPAGAPKARREPAPPPEVSPSRPGGGGQPWHEPVWDAAPEILLPEDPEESVRRRRWVRRARWAAMILVLLGAGRLLKGVFSGSPDLPLGDGDTYAVAPDTSQQVVSPQE